MYKQFEICFTALWRIIKARFHWALSWIRFCSMFRRILKKGNGILAWFQKQVFIDFRVQQENERQKTHQNQSKNKTMTFLCHFQFSFNSKSIFATCSWLVYLNERSCWMALCIVLIQLLEKTFNFLFVRRSVIKKGKLTFSSNTFSKKRIKS